jgi:hypothetical protein
MYKYRKESGSDKWYVYEGLKYKSIPFIGTKEQCYCMAKILNSPDFDIPFQFAMEWLKENKDKLTGMDEPALYDILEFDFALSLKIKTNKERIEIRENRKKERLARDLVFLKEEK